MDRQGRVKLRHHDVPVFIREGQADPMIALLDLLETQPAGDGALRMRDRRFEAAKSIERPDDVQFAGVFRRRVAERENFQLHKPPSLAASMHSSRMRVCPQREKPRAIQSAAEVAQAHEREK